MKLAVSIHRTGVPDSNGDWDKISRSEQVELVNADDRRLIRKEFAVRTKINTESDVADASQLDFFYQLFTPVMFCYNTWANEPVGSRNDRKLYQACPAGSKQTVMLHPAKGKHRENSCTTKRHQHCCAPGKITPWVKTYKHSHTFCGVLSC